MYLHAKMEYELLNILYISFCPIVPIEYTLKNSGLLKMGVCNCELQVVNTWEKLILELCNMGHDSSKLQKKKESSLFSDYAEENNTDNRGISSRKDPAVFFRKGRDNFIKIII